MKIERTSIALLATLVLTVAADAQNGSGIPEPNAEARDEMARLAPLVGDWDATLFTPSDDGGWQAMGIDRVTIHYLLNDLALREAIPEHSSMGWRLESTIQYDYLLDTYRLVAIDDTWGRMDVYEGDWVTDNTLELTNLESGVGFPVSDEHTLYFRLVTTIDDVNHNVFQVDMTLDGGQSWQPYQRMVRNRAADSGG